MNGEETSLIGDAWGKMTRDKFTHTAIAKWICVFLYVDIGFVLVDIDHTIILARLLHCKVTGDQRVIRPIQKAGGQPMLLTECQPVPVTGGHEIQKAQGALLKEPQDLFFIRFPRPD